MVGRLTMRGVTHEIRFTSKIPVLTATEMQATASLSIDRQDWGVAYRGSRLTNDLVDDEIHLQIVLAADRASGRS
jgi:polyisoprenoid-binding protein YceI